MNITEQLFLVADRLRRADVDYALCGGLAVVVHGYPRSTRDIDLMIHPDDLDRARAALAEVGFDLESGMLPFDVGKSTERHVFRLSKVEGDQLLTLDLMLVGPFLEDVWRARESVRVGENELTVVSLDGLVKMKRAAGRPQDLADLSGLGIGPEDE